MSSTASGSRWSAIAVARPVSDRSGCVIDRDTNHVTRMATPRARAASTRYARCRATASDSSWSALLASSSVTGPEHGVPVGLGVLARRVADDTVDVDVPVSSAFSTTSGNCWTSSEWNSDPDNSS